MGFIGNAIFKETNVTSAATCDIGAPTTRRVNITGTTTITSFGTRADCEKIVRFSGALTLTHNATSLILPDGEDIVTAAGDTCIAVSDDSGNWRVLAYRATGAWKTYSPASTSGSGSFGSEPATGKYRQLGGKAVAVRIKVAITAGNIGTASGALIVTLPFTLAGDFAAAAVETVATGTCHYAYGTAGGNTLTIYKYDGNPTIASNHTVVVSGVFERA